jgi:hypothetical protein
MKRFFYPILFFAGCALTCLAGELKPEEAKDLTDRALKIKEAMDKNDVDAIINTTHPVLFPLMGGKENFEKVTRAAVVRLKSSGIKQEESTLGTPTRTYSAGADTICFIPRTSIFSAEGKRIRSIGFLVAIRNTSSPEWLFLDGSGMRNNPALLKKLFPDLEDGVTFPENRKEVIE